MRLLKWPGKIIAVILALVVIGALVPRPLFPSRDAAEKTVEILVITNPIHTGIAIPASPEVLQMFGFLRDAGAALDSADLRWLIFGWGGRAFYLETPTWADLRPLPALKALTLDRSVMHVELAGEIDRHRGNVTSYRISAENARAAYGAIAESFTPGRQVIEGAGYGQFDQFYEAQGYFNLVAGCNTWAARVLREAGLQTGFWNPLPQTLGLSLRLHN